MNDKTQTIMLLRRSACWERTAYRSLQMLDISMLYLSSPSPVWMSAVFWVFTLCHVEFTSNLFESILACKAIRDLIVFFPSADPSPWISVEILCDYWTKPLGKSKFWVGNSIRCVGLKSTTAKVVPIPPQRSEENLTLKTGRAPWLGSLLLSS